MPKIWGVLKSSRFQRLLLFTIIWVIFTFISTGVVFRWDDIGATYWFAEARASYFIFAPLYLFLDYRLNIDVWNKKKMGIFIAAYIFLSSVFVPVLGTLLITFLMFITKAVPDIFYDILSYFGLYPPFF